MTESTVLCFLVILDQLSRPDNVDQQSLQCHRPIPVTPLDPVELVKGMYRLLDLIGESGSNGYGRKRFSESDLSG
jgi:hypothetical protein